MTANHLRPLLARLTAGDVTVETYYYDSQSLPCTGPSQPMTSRWKLTTTTVNHYALYWPVSLGDRRGFWIDYSDHVVPAHRVGFHLSRGSFHFAPAD